MSLQGDLSTLDFAGLFQNLEAARKSGLLTVQVPGQGETKLYFHQGKLALIAYEGREVTVTFNPMVCSHAAECGRIAVNIFDDQKRPWVQPDNGTLEQVHAVMAACPSGALALAGDPRGHMTAPAPQIRVIPNGPYWVQGIEPPAPLASADQTPRKYTLCRCGLSGTKPYCDGSHRDAKWRGCFAIFRMRFRKPCALPDVFRFRSISSNINIPTSRCRRARRRSSIWRT